MRYVKLLKTIVEPSGGPTAWIETARGNKPGTARPLESGDEKFVSQKKLVVKTTTQKNGPPLVFEAGAIIPMHEASAAKYVERGWAEYHESEKEDARDSAEPGT
jgi:hypothetical protein